MMWLRRVLLLLSFVVVGAPLVGCHQASAAGESCTLADGTKLEVGGREDGLFGVVGTRVDDLPIAHFHRMQKLSNGVDPSSGKRWIRLRLDEAEGEALRRFTAGAGERSIAVVVAGELACHHKIRAALETNDLQVSCCDPRACDRWEALLARE